MNTFHRSAKLLILVLTVATIATHHTHNSLAQTIINSEIKASGRWQANKLAANSLSFVYECDVVIDNIPEDLIIALSENASGSWKNLACIVRFNGEHSGVIDVRNGNEYTAMNSISVEPDGQYHLRMEVNIPKHRYSVWITPEEGREILLAEQYAFRTEQLDIRSLQWLQVYLANGSATVNHSTIKPTGNIPVGNVSMLPPDTEVLKKRALALYTGQPQNHTEGNYSFSAKKQLETVIDSILQQESWKREPDLNSPQASENVAAYYQKILTMSQGYCTPGQSFYRNQQLREAIIDSLRYGQQWLHPDSPRPGNWFFWRIGVPQRLLPVLLLLNDEIDQALMDDIKLSLRQLMGENPIMNGPNAVYEGYNHLLDGILRNSSWRIKNAMNAIRLEMTVTQESTGILEDYSFQFHGKMPYSGGYGAAYLDAVSKAIYLTENTKYALPHDRIGLVTRYMTRQARWPVIGSYYDPMVTGRSIGSPKTIERLIDSLSLMATLDVPNQNTIQKMAAEVIYNSGMNPSLHAASFADQLPSVSESSPTGIRYLYRSDMLIARRMRHYLSVKMFSDHVRDYEGQWGENLSGWNLSYGTTYFAYRGNEIWGPDGRIIEGYDWDHLPGTTSRWEARPQRSNNHGKKCFVGGAVDEYGGICGFELVPVAGNFKAQKSYFVFDKGFLAMGSGITSSQEGNPVNTTITQWPMAFEDTPMVLSDGNKVSPSTWDVETAAYQWVYCDRNGYLLNQAPVNIKCNKGILKMWFDHGSHPQNASYSYVVMPNISEKAFRSYVTAPTVRVLSQTPAIHAVEDTSSKSIGIIFWEAGTFAGITVDHPAVIFMQQHPQGMVLTVSNPLHTNTRLNLTLETPYEITTLPPGAHAANNQEATRVTLHTELGRMYRVGLGIADATEYPREDISPLEGFKVAVENTEDGALLDVSIPPALKDSDFQLIVYKAKGIVNKKFSKKDFIEVTPAGTYRYQWNNKRMKDGYYNIRLTNDVISSWLGFKVKYEQRFNESPSPKPLIR